MAGGLDELLNVQASALQVREARQGLLASNVANADTPNYKARDINFSATLQKVAQANKGPGPNGPLPLTVTSAAHQLGKNANADLISGSTQFRNDEQGSIDGNNVDVDYERGQLGDNSAHYEATVTLITAQIHNMLAVIQN
jgi:flagellar basal-body rod protein FlgB